MEVNSFHSDSQWTVIRYVKGLFVYLIPRFFAVDATAPKCVSKSTFYDKCEKMVCHDSNMEESVTDKLEFPSLLSGLKRTNCVNRLDLTKLTPNICKNNCTITQSSVFGTKKFELAMYDKCINTKIREPNVDMKYLVQFTYDMEIGKENIPKENGVTSLVAIKTSNTVLSSEKLEKNIETILNSKCNETETKSRLECIENSKVCDKKAIKRGSKRHIKSRSSIKREKKRTRCNNRRSRIPSTSNLVKNDKNFKLTQENNDGNSKKVQAANVKINENDIKKEIEENKMKKEIEENKMKKEKENKMKKEMEENKMKKEMEENKIEKEMEEEVFELKIDSVVEWSIVSEEEEKHLTYVNGCNSVAYIIDTSESLALCLDDDDWDYSDDDDDDAAIDNETWNLFQECGLHNGLCLDRFMGHSTTDGKTISVDDEDSEDEDEDEEELNCRIRIAEANERWKRGLKNFDLIQQSSRSQKKKVQFASDLVEVHLITSQSEEDRKGPWEECARDRERFSKKIRDLEPIISRVLSENHRAKIYKKLYC